MNDCGFRFDNSYLRLPEAFYARLDPVPVAAPGVIIFNDALAEEMGLDCADLGTEAIAALCAGNAIPSGAEPFAQAYAGHQFGHFTMLGDGRAVALGEHITPDGKRLDIQYKGSGRTPYSRGGDGRAALGPMLREYVMSESMHNLGIPTTRSLAVVSTGETVIREAVLPGAILTRVAGSHIRVGTFQFAAAHREAGLTQSLLDYTIARHYPALNDNDQKAAALLDAVMESQIDLIVHWMRVGFIHGVMNTDNVTLCTETIDYGPCAFMDSYDPKTVFSSIDRNGRYAYDNQPRIAHWNIARLAEALLPLIHEDTDQAVTIAESIINTFADRYQEKWIRMMRTKLGLFGEQADDAALISDLLDWAQRNHADFTNTFRDLSQERQPDGELYAQQSFQDWYARWQARLQQNTKPLKSSLCLMRNNNPAVIPRNHKVEEALDAAHRGDLKPFNDLLAALRTPYVYSEGLAAYQMPPAPGERVYQTFCGT